LTTPFIVRDNLQEAIANRQETWSEKLYLHPYLTSAELKKRYICAKDGVESRRWHLLWLVSLDWTIRQASQAVGLNYDYAKDIVKGYNQQGEKAIANRRHQPRELPSHALLNTEQLSSST
jgi:hypothetical protein